ncbi:MAG: serine--tRNA ligase [Planctomycetota bacterium]|nr:MAG: serine--tRNA ligase [Planctomycetota bacterium]REJ91495.1 MAG: serine--tRNA ligase [Planctomycetota bacterium]REK26957.1 MAG: serine--tRNA ligase [Planctomycetota bacterium]REK44313.1 MAG: serine--tRNA ligase [Planctomycetota bacterium]
MLDRKFVIENIELVEENCRHRGVTVDVRKLADLEQQRRAKQIEAEDLNRQANEKSKLIGKAAEGAEREALKEGARQLREQKEQAAAEVDALAAEADAILRVIPNLSHPAAPIGVDDKANLELRKGKHQPPVFDFPVLDHVQLGERLDLFDFEAGGKVAGHGFYYLKNEAAQLELALQQYVLNLLVGEGFTPTITPDLARNEILQGIGFIPRGPETQIYSVADTDLSLIATAEITLGGWYAKETFDSDQLPLKLCGVSHCYRTEAGAHGAATRGLYRVHQFTKVEMFAFTLPDESEEMLEYFCGLECRIFDELGIPYRVVDTATGDLGGPAYRKYDLEAWMPGRGDGGEYGEVTSTSNCTEYQARRLAIRYRIKGEKGTHFVHTLNGTAVAISRALIAILENNQRADGSVAVPEVLQPLLGKDVIEPRK